LVIKWSKTKSILEGFICEKLQGRIKINATVYRKFHDEPSRVWITFDKKEIISASDVTYQTRYEETYRKIKKKENLKGIPFNSNWEVMFQSPERQALIKASDKSEEMMIDQNIFSSYHFYEPFMEYSSLSIEEALSSENILIRAFAMFDRRLGKRRLKNLRFTSENTHPLILEFYKIRCDVEGIYVTKNPQPKK